MKDHTGIGSAWQDQGISKEKILERVYQAWTPIFEIRDSNGVITTNVHNTELRPIIAEAFQWMRTLAVARGSLDIDF